MTILSPEEFLAAFEKLKTAFRRKSGQIFNSEKNQRRKVKRMIGARQFRRLTLTSYALKREKQQ